MAIDDRKTAGTPPSKADFANPAQRFANRALPRRSERVLVLATLVATLFCGLSGPFGTFAMPLGQRLAFWAILFGINALLWGWWFRVRSTPRIGWKRVAAEGAFLFSLPMPLEIEGVGRLVGQPMALHWPSIWLQTAALAGIVGIALLVVMARGERTRAAKGLLFREGFGDGSALASIRAEDHFCRLADREGREKLVYARFSDLVEEVEALDGLVVRRGCWVAAGAVTGVAREGRRWQVALADGSRIAVPDGKVGELRAAGWI
ncbi:hypothetical protein [Sphingomicrobium nitratireducens]|uniref:hypothetical protein n=1 Tax=Sphingomicrobium nitratireducens TaxID=2964666 RepID=UPI00223F06C4|nr:hypothetical protein [Sphingomicrobium nitratireducens]